MSNMDPATAAGTRIAAEFLTAWIEWDRENAATYIDAVLNDPEGPGVASIIAGQLNVGKALVWWLANAYGAETDDDIRTVAAEILRGLARDVAQ
jgi:hypothetical protein